ncbi:Hypothetical protein CINCED_3A007455 [Cinara cedri]|uniref:Reverse transcriptase domain n=1 Tax=Cinara cedri TaxID=506608 RepID=A0A5E4N0M0_9HEMI|nr:Hypothetical protein CINCED_3A007455 [Cinara cedri]
MELFRNKTILACVDDIMVIGCSREEIITETAKLIMAAKLMGFKINQIKTKYMVIDRRAGIVQDLKIGNYNFQHVTDFKYLGTNLKNANNMHNEIKLRISAANKAQYQVIYERQTFEIDENAWKSTGIIKNIMTSTNNGKRPRGRSREMDRHSQIRPQKFAPESKLEKCR